MFFFPNLISNAIKLWTSAGNRINGKFVYPHQVVSYRQAILMGC